MNAPSSTGSFTGIGGMRTQRALARSPTCGAVSTDSMSTKTKQEREE